MITKIGAEIVRPSISNIKPAKLESAGVYNRVVSQPDAKEVSKVYKTMLNTHYNGKVPGVIPQDVQKQLYAKATEQLTRSAKPAVNISNLSMPSGSTNILPSNPNVLNNDYVKGYNAAVQSNPTYKPPVVKTPGAARKWLMRGGMVGLGGLGAYGLYRGYRWLRGSDSNDMSEQPFVQQPYYYGGGY